ncbi:SRPBCC domain-containing protein [Paraneptunicella aestuarii]|uniref:SRPBCC family protein n=1 Tax=Paraneptunicella aestuarii TaxID=2831148 RepID=UPI001E4D695E|nr:SRPBCC domain-containing protein [Paraneptunicella aestuarii]UAA39229.1 SRPBCC domain-containing protein [Paraneptunicella aestuarii]
MATMNALHIENQVPINAKPDVVWKAFTQEIQNWWAPQFNALDNSRINLELRTGGRLYESNPAGAENLWFTITSFYPGNFIEFVGNLKPQYGGPATDMLKLTFHPYKNGTLVHIDDHIYGPVSEGARQFLGQGWLMIISAGLKAYVESKN